MYSNYQIIKILENCFQSRNYFFWIKVISVLIHFKYCYYNIPSLKLPCLPRHPCQISPQPTETSLQGSPHHALHLFSKFIINLYLNLLSTFKNSESPRASFFQSQTTLSTKTLPSIQSVINSLQNGRCSLIFTTRLTDATTLTISTKFFLLVIPCLSILPLIVHKFILTIPTNTPFF